MTFAATDASGAPPAAARRIVALRWLLLWVLSRAVLVVLIRAPFEGNALADVATYFEWTQWAWLHGLLPGRDFPSEYPPGAFPLILLPATGHGPFGYLRYFGSLMLAFDGALLGFLLRQGCERAALHLWVWAPLLLGPLFLERFDVVPAVLAGLALGLAVRRPAIAGIVAALATAVKVWPVALVPLVVAGRQRWRASMTGLAGTAAVVLLLSWVVGVWGAWRTTLDQQSGRNLQVESVVATPFDWLRETPVYRHGSWEVTAPGADTAGSVIWFAGVVLVVALVLRQLQHVRRGDPVDVPLAGAAVVAWLLVIDKALSPQYVVWLMAVVAVAACRPFRHRRVVVVLVLVASGLTQVVYPLAYRPFLRGHVLPLTALTARNACLVAIAVLLLGALRHDRAR